MIRGYLGAFGPATPESFDQWLLRGATPRARLRQWFTGLAPHPTRAPSASSPPD